MKRSRFYGKYRAAVTNNKDPQKRKRIKVTCPRILGGLESSWALPCLPPHLFDVPDVGQLVWIEFEGGLLDFPIWSGGWDASPNISPEAVEGYNVGGGEPLVKQFKTKAGYSIEFREIGGQGFIKVVTPKGQEILLDDTDGAEKVQIKDKAGNQVKLDSVGSKIEVVSPGDITVTAGGNATVNGASVLLGGGGPPVARVGDPIKVTISGGSSAGTYQGEIVEGSGKVFASD